jgi:hypothetical protein
MGNSQSGSKFLDWRAFSAPESKADFITSKVPHGVPLETFNEDKFCSIFVDPVSGLRVHASSASIFSNRRQDLFNT